MKTLMKTLAFGAAVSVIASYAHAQSGTLDKAVGGYSFEDAAKEAPTTKDFHSKDGKLTFAIITHTAGNGFFDPTYVGAQVAANAFGINLIKLGSEAPVDDIPREIEILNQVINDPTIDGLILTTPQSGAYDDIVKKAFANGIPVATTNSFDPKIANRSQISHTGQQSQAAAIGGEALAKCVLASGAKGGSIIFPSTTTLGNEEVNRRVTAAFEATVKGLNDAGRLADFKVDAGPENIGIDVNKDDITNSVVSLIESRGDVVGAFAANGFVTPALGDAVAQLKLNGKVCAFGFDLGPKQQEQIRTGALTGSLGQQPFLQGFWPVAQLYLQIDRGISAANLDTSAQLVTKDTVDLVGKRFEN
ncbi:substrate-binding domain-containing protein [Kaistia dalseonensis]|uniref:Simple sugar transport system substrate-binding protein n=1 Tax=Kaistia dalseonensis TaxID=410840 RepID=A0ABU0H0W3_9HYPH|nr:substrate-binding domain-containing protein [Kaistia dalseonensis]MCX5493391.1 substrate-binding domain-containing protein [Kaistia dalseonensis]MDQ0435949.1 simple sugar transport system substrate-binding protein [Kaistia dalseonensis]